MILCLLCFFYYLHCLTYFLRKYMIMSGSSMKYIAKALIRASERAATIARVCCQGDEVLLLAEKSDGEANTRFEKDFKTIADVLAQVCAKDELAVAENCKGLADNVRGEECCEIGGISVELQESIEKTAELLHSIVPKKEAMRLANAAHCDIQIGLPDIVLQNEDFPDINPADVGVWIDPIDATAEFIAGVNKEAGADNGLPCVTVLIGAYLKSTGEPLFGVINQPFFDNGPRLQGRLIWGLCHGDFCQWGLTDTKPEKTSNTILVSAAEDPTLVAKFKGLGWDVDSVPGAGHKLLKVALGEAASYILSKGTTFRWDTCGPHAILKARGGDILDYTTKLPITYNDPDDQETKAYCNSGGIIAYGDVAVFDKLKNLLF